MDRIAYLERIILSIDENIEMCFELTDDILSDPDAVDAVDRSIVLQEVIGDLRVSSSRLELMRSRMERDGA